MDGMTSEFPRSAARIIWWRHVPNGISLARLCVCPVLLWAVLAGERELFRVLLLSCLLSDIADGLIARVLRVRSALGASLDSAADILVSLLVVPAVCVFEVRFFAEHWPPMAVVLSLYLAEAGLSLWRYGRLSSFHTSLYRVAAYAEGIFVIFLFFQGYTAWLFYVMTALLMLASAEELGLLIVLPEWKPDVGGLYQVLRQAREKSA